MNQLEVINFASLTAKFFTLVHKHRVVSQLHGKYMAQNHATDKVEVCFVLVRNVVSEFLIVLNLSLVRRGR